jgi:thioredoxin-related protein
MRTRATVVLALLTVMAAGPLLAADDLWTEDATQAMATAAKEGKDLLINFTGSDWCGWCVKLDKEVFSQEAFTSEAPKHFVMLKLDFPRRRQMPAETKKQNAEWRDRMGVRGYPTIMLADAKGKPYAKTGYQRGGAEAYVKHLAELRQTRVKRDEAFARAAKAKGAEKAKALDAALSLLDPAIQNKAYGDVIEQIVKLDADGSAGLKAKYEKIALKAKIDAAMAARKLDEAITLCDEALARIGNKGDAAQEILLMKASAYFMKQDRENARKLLEAALEAAPDSRMAGPIKAALKKHFQGEK